MGRKSLLPVLCIRPSVLLAGQPVEAPTLLGNVVIGLGGVEREYVCVCKYRSKEGTVYGVFYSETVIGTLGLSKSYEVG